MSKRFFLVESCGFAVENVSFRQFRGRMMLVIVSHAKLQAVSWSNDSGHGFACETSSFGVETRTRAARAEVFAVETLPRAAKVECQFCALVLTPPVNSIPLSPTDSIW